MEVTSGGINDNPWAGVVVPTASNNPGEATSRQQRRGATTCTDITLHKLVQAFLVVDVCGCLAGIIYGLVLVLAKPTQDVPLWPTILVWVTAVWLGIRILSVTAALYYSHILELCGLSLAAHISVVLGLQTLLLSLLSAVYQKRMHHAEWWAHHFAHIPVQEGSGWLLHTVQPWFWLVLLILALLEVPVRWYLYHAYRYRRLQQEEDDLQQTALISHASTQRRPWWWSRNSGHRAAEVPRIDGDGNLDRDNNGDDLRRALLEDAEAAAGDDRVGTNGLPQWARDDRRNRAAAAPPPPSMFSWLFGGGKDSDHNPRDDGSVDFASVQEEWASRSEEDPLWWSRDNPQPFVPTSSRATVKATGGTPARVSAFNRNTTRNNNDRSDQANNPQEAQQKIPDFVDTTTSPNSSTHQTTGASVVSEL